MAESRTKNVIKNSFFGIACQAFNFLLNFISRTFFIKFLGAEYLGINGLFSNILIVLSFAELGIGSAITYSLYKPIAEGNTEKVKSLMFLYKKAYQIVGLTVLTLGVFTAPFISFLIKETPNINESIYLIYFFFLFDTGSSYFLVYKKSLLIADQKNYYIVLINELVHLIQISLQILVLFLTKNYILFLIVSIGSTLLKNIVAALLTNRLYPYLKERASLPPKEERDSIIKNVKNLALYKFGNTILNGTDNILISSFVGLSSVGLASNYVLITTSCNSILGKIEEAFIASVGNLNTNSTSEKKYDIFKKMFLVTFWIYGFVSAGIIAVSNNFISAWIGEEYVMPFNVIVALVLGFYVSGMHNPAYIYRTTLGLFKEGRFSPLLSVVINISLSIILFQFLGIAGIYYATPIALFFSLGLVDPILIYKKAFFVPPRKYYLKYFIYFLIQVLLTIVCLIICFYIPINGWLGVVVKIIVVTIIYNLLFLLIFAKNKDFKELIITIKELIKRRKNVRFKN